MRRPTYVMRAHTLPSDKRYYTFVIFNKQGWDFTPVFIRKRAQAVAWILNQAWMLVLSVAAAEKKDVEVWLDEDAEIMGTVLGGGAARARNIREAFKKLEGGGNLWGAMKLLEQVEDSDRRVTVYTGHIPREGMCIDLNNQDAWEEVLWNRVQWGQKVWTSRGRGSDEGFCAAGPFYVEDLQFKHLASDPPKQPGKVSFSSFVHKVEDLIIPRKI